LLDAVGGDSEAMTVDPMERERALEGLNAALELQASSALRFAFAAGSARGIAGQFVGAELWGFAQKELDDTRRVVEKIVALGGEPRVGATVDLRVADVDAVLEAAIEAERKTVEAFREVIPSTGNEGEGEALEHLLEHVIMRKQQQIDFLLRARG